MDPIKKKPVKLNEKSTGVESLTELIRVLRGDRGCPWDAKQTPKSMLVCLLEESYELVDAVGSADPDHICEEIGDVLFQLLFIIELFCEREAFDLEKVVSVVRDKMIRRHPHVFSDKEVKNEQEVAVQWDQIKSEEVDRDKSVSLLDSIPSGLPALLRAYKVSDRVCRAGFDWENVGQVMKKVEEEWGEFNEAVCGKNTDAISLEFGDLLFTLANVARFSHIHPETALSESTLKFEKRYRFMEDQLLKDGKTVNTADRMEVEKLWEKAKITVG